MKTISLLVVAWVLAGCSSALVATDAGSDAGFVSVADGGSGGAGGMGGGSSVGGGSVGGGSGGGGSGSGGGVGADSCVAMGSDYSRCLNSAPYCFHLPTDSIHCGVCTNDCQKRFAADAKPDFICRDGACEKAACDVDGGCGGSGVCCGATCCSSVQFCCNSSTGLRCVSAGGETQCPW